MQITAQLKEKVVNALFADMKERAYTSQNEYAKYIRNLLCVKFDKSALSSIKIAEKRNFLKDSTWLILAKHFNLLSKSGWKTAQTHTYITINTRLEACKKFGIWQVLCDRAGIGKTYSAQAFTDKYKSTSFYIDCSENATKGEFITALARQFGIEKTGSYNQLWREVTDELLLLEEPILILDEFGDVHESIITLMKSLYNKADMGDSMALSVYHIGADNLEKRLIDGRRSKKQSYAEYWSRFNGMITDLGFSNKKPDALKSEIQKEIEKIVDANLSPELESTRNEIVTNCLGTYGVRSVRKELVRQSLIHKNNS